MFKKTFITSFLAIALMLTGCSLNDDSSANEMNNETNEVENASINTETNAEVNDVETNNEDNNKNNSEDETSKEEESNDNHKVVDMNELVVHFIDVGQADAALLTYTHEDTEYNLLIDSGDWNGNEVVNYLNEFNVSNIDLAIGTHPHADHIGQLDQVINEFNVKEVWLSGDTADSQVFERLVDAIENNDVDYNEPRAGESYEIGSLEIDVVSPMSLNGDLNDDSIVVKLTYGNSTFLFTGDAESNAESGMLSRGEDISADILKVGHHGSNTSSTPGFIEEVDPDIAVISVAENSKYDHPSKEVVDRLENRNLDLYATSSHGTIIVKTNGEKYEVTTKEDGNITPGSTSGGSQKKTSNVEEKEVDDEPDEEYIDTDDEFEGCVNINNADEIELQEIIHIGPERAGYLMDERPFKSIDDLKRVNGIGPARLEDIKAQGIVCT